MRARIEGVAGWVMRCGKLEGAAVLLALCLAVYLPGVIRLPAVDRTEIIFAETTRQMVANGNWLDPRYGETVHQFRPIGTYWLQGISAAIAGEGAAREITVYRLPGMIAVTLAVLALYLLAQPIFGTPAALIAGGLFAVAPLTVLAAHLAIAEGLTLFPATVVMLALLRIYSAEREEDTRLLALSFWVALGFGVVINALLVPILVIVTLFALRYFDRDYWWLDRLHTGKFLWIFLLVSAPWLIVRFYQDGVLYAGLGVGEILEALGGSQDMKLRAMPGTFVVALLLGFLPGTALLLPALGRLWQSREAKAARFLLAWVIGYLVYLELLSAKPGTYMVQPMFPALAIAVGALVVAADGKASPPKFNLYPWPPLAALFAVLLFAMPYGFLRVWPAPWLWPAMAAVAALFYLSAVRGRAGRLMGWAVSGVGALGLFAVVLIGGVFPSLDVIWPAKQLSRAFESCVPGRRAIFGFKEPSAWFVAGGERALSTPEGFRQIANGAVPGYAVIEQGWYDRNSHLLSRREKGLIQPLLCFNAINVMRGCRVSLTVTGRDGTVGCKPPAAFACTTEFMLESLGSGPFQPCD